MANLFQRAAGWLKDKAYGRPPSVPSPPGEALPAPVDYSAEVRDRLFARLDQFAQQRREERRATQETPAMTETVREAQHELRQAKEAQQERAGQFWQTAVEQGRQLRQATEQVKEQVQEKAPEPAQTP